MGVHEVRVCGAGAAVAVELAAGEPETLLRARSAQAIGIALSSWPGSIVLVSHDAEFVEALAPDVALLLPEGTLDYWSNDLLNLLPLA